MEADYKKFTVHYFLEFPPVRGGNAYAQTIYALDEANARHFVVADINGKYANQPIRPKVIITDVLVV